MPQHPPQYPPRYAIFGGRLVPVPVPTPARTAATKRPGPARAERSVPDPPPAKIPRRITSRESPPPSASEPAPRRASDDPDAALRSAILDLPRELRVRVLARTRLSIDARRALGIPPGKLVVPQRVVDLLESVPRPTAVRPGRFVVALPEMRIELDFRGRSTNLSYVHQHRWTSAAARYVWYDWWMTACPWTQLSLRRVEKAPRPRRL